MSRKEKIISLSALIFLIVMTAALVFILALKDAPGSVTDGAVNTNHTIMFEYFDTTTEIMDFSGESKDAFEEKCSAAEKIFEKYHKLCDIYHSYSGINNIKTVNDSAGEPVKVTPELMEILDYSKKMYTVSDGSLNIAMGSVLKLWHNYREDAALTPDISDNKIPTVQELSAAAEHCDIEKMILDKENMTVTLTDPKMSLDLGAVAKGYAVERAAEALISMGADGYIINSGGNIRLIGEKPNGTDWEIAIRDPFGAEGQIKTLKLASGAAVTSGGYERYYVSQGKRYHHIIDTDTLMPAEHFASVTVVHPDSGLADCLSTALFASSREDGLKILKRLEDTGAEKAKAIWISADGSISEY